MNIKGYKQVVISGPEDGQTVAMIVDKTAYLIQCDGMSDAFLRMKNKLGIQTHEWLLTNEKAVLIPGVWEYQMAQCIRGKDSLDVRKMVEESEQRMQEAA